MGGKIDDVESWDQLALDGIAGNNFLLAVDHSVGAGTDQIPSRRVNVAGNEVERGGGASSGGGPIPT